MRQSEMRMNMVLLTFIGLLSVYFVVITTARLENTRTDDELSIVSPYRIILDGGSTGSRLYVYEFTHSTSTNITSCHRRLNTKAEIPISSFATSPTPSVAKHLLPLFYSAAEVIPPRYHSTTSVHYQATAGMRLLSPQVQKQIYDNLFNGLIEDEGGFAFGNAMERDYVGTLEGHLEAFYGAMAANYLEGVIDVNLRLTDDVGNGGGGIDEGPLGALDMGGASMQIVYLTDSKEDGYADSDSSSIKCAGDRNTLCEEEFFSKSYLSYGANEARKRLWNQLIIDSQRRDRKQGNATSDEDGKKIILNNPCFYEGYTAEYNGYTLLGTGGTEECTVQIQRLIKHQPAMDNMNYTGITTNTNNTQNGRIVGGIEHPPIKGKFIAMSLFYYSLDCLRELSNNDKLSLSWPNPSIEELGNALDGLCSRKWYGDLKENQQSLHSLTSASVLPHRCFESVYIVTLLRDGFGFLPQSRDITFTNLVKGSVVDWSLGMALALFAQEENPAATILREENFDEDGKEVERNMIRRG